MTIPPKNAGLVYKYKLIQVGALQLFLKQTIIIHIGEALFIKENGNWQIKINDVVAQGFVSLMNMGNAGVAKFGMVKRWLLRS